MAELDLVDFERRMNGALEVLRGELSGLRTGRASAALLEPINVDAYGQTMPLTQVGTVSVPDARMVSVHVIRVPIPQLTEQRRAELSKVADKYAEQSKISVRNIRRDGMETLKKLEKQGEISQDEQRAWEDDLQSLTDRKVKDVDALLNEKKQEIMQV